MISSYGEFNLKWLHSSIVQHLQISEGDVTIIRTMLMTLSDLRIPAGDLSATRQHQLRPLDDPQHYLFRCFCAQISHAHQFCPWYQVAGIQNMEDGYLMNQRSNEYRRWVYFEIFIGVIHTMFASLVHCWTAWARRTWRSSGRVMFFRKTRSVRRIMSRIS